MYTMIVDEQCVGKGDASRGNVSRRVYIPPFPRTCCPMLSIEDITNAPAVRDNCPGPFPNWTSACLFDRSARAATSRLLGSITYDREHGFDLEAFKDWLDNEHGQQQRPRLHHSPRTCPPVLHPTRKRTQSQCTRLRCIHRCTSLYHQSLIHNPHTSNTLVHSQPLHFTHPCTRLTTHSLLPLR
jgi:hypothetical protein